MKKKVSIHKLKQSEYLTGSQLALENSNSLLEVSTLSKANGRYGIASSLLVLSFEELTKAVVLKIKGLNNQIPIVDFDSFFRLHKKKHEVAYSIYLSIIDSEGSSATTVEKVTTVKDDWALVAIIIIVLGFIFLTKNSENAKQKKSELDKIKENGFYTDFDINNRRWVSPDTEFSLEEYDEFSNFISGVMKVLRDWAFGGKLDKENILDEIISFNKDIVSKEKLEKLIFDKQSQDC